MSDPTTSDEQATSPPSKPLGQATIAANAVVGFLIGFMGFLFSILFGIPGPIVLTGGVVLVTSACFFVIPTSAATRIFWSGVTAGAAVGWVHSIIDVLSN